MLGQKLPRGQHKKHITTDFRNVIVQLHNCHKCHKLLSLGMQCQGEKQSGPRKPRFTRLGFGPSTFKGRIAGVIDLGDPSPLTRLCIFNHFHQVGLW